MTSREYAEMLRKHADELDSLPEFQTPDYYDHSLGTMAYFYEKSAFVSAVRALGSGSKEIQGDRLRFRPKNASFALEIDRSSVCKVVKPAEWSCEPWLTDAQQIVVDEAASQATEEGVPF
jgi:hypothetical protein